MHTSFTRSFWLSLLAPSLVLAASSAELCLLLGKTYIKDVRSIDTTYLNAGESYRVPASCGVTLGSDLLAKAVVDVCIVNVVYNTSKTSATRIEAWLPNEDAWNGRLLGTGGGGLGGCVDYGDLDYGTSLGFATFGSDGGHDGDSGAALAQNDEVIADYAHRGLHVATIASKALVRAYYGRAHRKAYYVGCSTGGRQGFRAAQEHPADFDGVLAGAPALDFGHSMAFLTVENAAARKLDDAQWDLVRKEVLRQCDGLDGRLDGIIDDPDQCAFLPETLLCGNGGDAQKDCLLPEQVEAVRTMHAPLYNDRGELFYRGLDPGAEGDTDAFGVIAAAPYSAMATDWFRYIVYKNASWTPTPDFGLADFDAADRREAQINVNSWNPDLSAFRACGGRLLSYHGRRDVLIPAGNSIRYYHQVARTLSLPPSGLDEFYRLFLIPGMNHCYFGPGAWQFGQINAFSNWANTSDANALLALVEWVENGRAPETIRGSANGTREGSRLHCRYPRRSVWGVEKGDWECVDEP